MNFDLSDEQKMLADQARGLLSEKSSADRLRALIDAGAEWDEALWREVAQMGFLGAAIPETYGGLGLSALDQGVIAAEFGRANAAIPFFSSVVLGGNAIVLGGSEAQKRAWLPGIASGEVIATMTYPGAAGAPGVSFKNGKLFGHAAPVADAGVAQIAVVVCEGGKALAVVKLDQAGVKRDKMESFDQLRAHYELTFDGAAAEALDAGVLERVWERAAVQAAFEAVGGAEACLFMARDYTMQRQIFGRALASYQAVKHKLADIVLAVEFAKSNAYFAAWAVDDSPDDLPAASAAARLSALTAFEQAARENLQLHGGIGYTFEADCHFYYRRERTLALALGGKQYWADRLLARAQQTRAA